jgi:hypothetical protein
VHDSLLHGETLLVVAAGDLEDVAFEFVADAVAWDFGAHSVGEEGQQLVSWRLCHSYLLSMKTRSFLSSSISMSFWLPLAGCVGCQFVVLGISRWRELGTYEGDVLSAEKLADVRN